MQDGEEISAQAETARAKAVGSLLPALRELLHVTDLKWDDVQNDFRLLVINHVIRRQLESIEAALSLGTVGLGHHSVSFIRTALEEMLWTKYLAALPLATSQRVLVALAGYDSLRSLSAQREYIGDEEMRSLWYTPSFLAESEERLKAVEADLKTLKKELGWPGAIPSTSWIAESVNEVRTYRYLHSATSRSVHFSAGEAFRRSWGWPGGILTTDKPEFRVHLYEFALDKLWRLLMSTMEGSMKLLSDAGIMSDDALDEERLLALVNAVLELNMVPLVHAHEWNLTPEGPLKFP